MTLISIRLVFRVWRRSTILLKAFRASAAALVPEQLYHQLPVWIAKLPGMEEQKTPEDPLWKNVATRGGVLHILEPRWRDG